MARKKILASILSVAMITAMAVPAWANVEEVAVSAHPNLTAYETNYSTVVNLSNVTSTEQIDLMVWGASSDWTDIGFLSDAEAEDVTWSVIEPSGGNAGVSISDAMFIPVDTDQNIAMATVNVTKDAKPGLTVVEASNSQGGYTDFSIVINGENPVSSVSNIQTRYYDASGSKEVFKGAVTCNPVKSNNHYGRSNYPSALDCFLTALITAGTPISNYDIVDNYGTYTVKSITFGSEKPLDTDFTDMSSPGWQYRVYDKNGVMRNISAKVAADELSLNDEDIVVWKYGTYYGTTFSETVPTTLSNN